MANPRILTAAQLGLHFVDVGFGILGDENYLTGHHAAVAAVRGSDKHIVAREIELLRQFHRDHKAKGWGGIGYFVCFGRTGVIYLLRPTAMKGAHVGGFNSNNLGGVLIATTGDTPTIRQMRAFRWYLRNAHTKRVPAAHRTDRDLRRAVRRGHNDWSGHTTNACPGTVKRFWLTGGKKR